MRMRTKKWAKPELEVCPFCIKEAFRLRGNWRKNFADPQAPLYVEFGCGKGGFMAQLALQNPKVNFIAVDMISDMLGCARRNIANLYAENGREVDNVKIAIHNLEFADTLFAPEDSIDRIYINFCNPWPRPRHFKRRLTHSQQLEKYRTFLKDGGEVRFKTDDMPLFKDSVKYFEESGFEITYITEDLHNSGFTDNIVTEHEKMFTEEGITTKFLIAKKLPSKE